MFRRRCAPFVIVSLALLVHAQSRSSSTPSMKGTVVTRPEQRTGLWESDDGSGGAVGINLRLITTIKGQPKTFAGWSQYWDSMQIGVYQRHGSGQNVGDANWIMDNLGGVNFDGTRLVAKMPDLSIDVDLSYMTFKTRLGMGGSIAVLSHGEWYSVVLVQNRALPRVDSSVRGVWVSLRESAYTLMGGREGGNASLSFQWRKVDGDSCVQQMR